MKRKWVKVDDFWVPTSHFFVERGKRRGRKFRKINLESSPAALLRAFYRRNGYVRAYSPERRKQLHSKKGYEVRLIAINRDEVRALKNALKAVKIKPGSSFGKFGQFILPIYGKEQVLSFFKVTGWLKKTPAKKK
ncbi:MAG: hypothetical protein V2G33_05365 [bacterium JZ-2024 1]